MSSPYVAGEDNPVRRPWSGVPSATRYSYAVHLTTTRDRLTAALADTYRIERELGGGGMSQVFLATELALARDVVVKVLPLESGAWLSGERFVRETALAARLQQANIVPLLHAGVADGLPFYTMPYVAGQSLRQRIDAQGALPLTEAISVLRDVARALSFAHAQGVVHRDIKPDNILLSHGAAMVTDFGIAKALAGPAPTADGVALTGTGISVGTPAYMAPEQATGDSATDHRADLYAWGVVAWELLAGRHPFGDRPSNAAMVTAHLTIVPPPLSTVRPEVPPALDALVTRALAKDPDARPPSADALLQALDLLHSTPNASAPRSARRLPNVAAVAAVLVVVATFALWRGRGGADARETAATRAGPAVISTLAILPFAELGGGGEDTHFGDGVAETLISTLSRVPGLSVSARGSAFSLRDRQSDVREIGAKLGVAAIVTGSVQRAASQLRISARLVRTADDSILWSATFDRSAAEIFAVQDEVARAVTLALQPMTDRGVATQARSGTSGGTSDPEAYDAYLLGRYHWNLRTTTGMIRAAEAFRRAIARDSNYALAWSGLADTYALSIPGEYNVPGTPTDSFLVWGERAARRAIAIAPDLGEGYVSLAEVVGQAGRWEEELPLFTKGVSLAPNYPTGRQWYAYSLMGQARFPEGIREMEAAHRLDPLAHVITLSLAFAYHGMDEFKTAMPLFEQGLAQQPEAWYAWRGLFAYHLAQRDLAKAGEALREATRDRAYAVTPAYARLAAVWNNASARERVTDSLIARGPWELAMPLARHLRGGDVAVQTAIRLLRDPRSDQHWALLALMGPQLRAEPRVAPLLRGGSSAAK